MLPFGLLLTLEIIKAQSCVVAPVAPVGNNDGKYAPTVQSFMVITTSDEQTFNNISSELTKIGSSKTVNLNFIPIEYTNFVQCNETGIDFLNIYSIYIFYTRIQNYN